jgi:16S rRNA (guanine527-N7)-methyltransferase
MLHPNENAAACSPGAPGPHANENAAGLSLGALGPYPHENAAAFSLGPLGRMAPPMPDVAAAIFGQAAAKAEQYARQLAGPGVDRGLIGPNEIPRIWERHLLNCAAVANLVPSSCSLADLGSGAGLPGIVLALLLPGVSVTLVEPMARRAAFLEECVIELGLDNVRVRRGRAEELAGTLVVDVVTARAVAPLDRLAALAVPLLRPGGTVLAIKGAKAAQEVAAARGVLARLGVQEVEVLLTGSGKVDPAATVVRLTVGP